MSSAVGSGTRLPNQMTHKTKSPLHQSVSDYVHIKLQKAISSGLYDTKCCTKTRPAQAIRTILSDKRVQNNEDMFPSTDLPAPLSVRLRMISGAHPQLSMDQPKELSPQNASKDAVTI